MVIILHLGLVFISFTVGITYVVDFYDIMVSVTFVVVITLIILWVMQMLMKHKM